MATGMSELILNGILHLFALISSGTGANGLDRARQMVADYLSKDLGIVDTTVYLGLFEGFLGVYGPETGRKTLVTRAGEICGILKGKLPRAGQYTVLLRLLELARPMSPQDSGLVTEVAESAGKAFGIEQSAVTDILAFLYHAREPGRLSSCMVYLAPQPPDGPMPCQWLTRPSFSGGATLLYLGDIDTLFLTPHEAGHLTLNGIPLRNGAFYPVPAGSILRDRHGQPVYYADLMSSVKPQHTGAGVAMAGQHVDFRFPGSDNGLHDFCFEAAGGQMIGVMGGSGVGKSTLVNILTGGQAPDSGQIRVNGIDLYADPKALEGVIGLVPQDDLLFEDLTVYENLASSTRLCLAHLSPERLDSRVTDLLKELNQWETRDLRAGSPLDKTISGGQRKRLNIALELIREPAILFVDEPTSGLSSADSLNVMSLLKEQSKKGRLIIVIIHQPSSDIFKMFDQLWILDKGGRPVYTGNPVDCLAYFREAVHQAGNQESLCPRCGNVWPEQIFEILEMKALDSKGYATAERRFSPDHWHQRHIEHRPWGADLSGQSREAPPRALCRPGRLGQMAVFFRRTAMTRLANTSYLAVNLLVAPFLAALIAWVTRYEGDQGYAFGDNHHIPVYCFMSVVVALFMGLSVSAEEIIKDRRVLKRERFLHLSWCSYINAKVLYLGLVAGVQTGLYVLVGNTILQVPDFFLAFWGILFSCAVCASMMGLILSATLKTAVTIYILIPLLLIPQIILGGMVIPFDDLIPRDAVHNRVPAVGNIMPSRWGFEAAVVALYRHNRFQAPLNEADQQISRADYHLNYYLPELHSQMDYPFSQASGPGHDAKSATCLALLKNEVKCLGLETGLGPDAFDPAAYSRDTANQLKKALADLAASWRKERGQADRLRRQIAAQRLKALGQEGYLDLERRQKNRRVADLVRNRDNLDAYRLVGNAIVRLSDPIFSTDLSAWGNAPFFAGQKRIGPFILWTGWFNPLVLWGMTLLLYALLAGQWPERVHTCCAGAVRRLLPHPSSESLENFLFS